ncbi:M90 family metallopeptidase [Thiohalobacter thiocyanaticus]|uniref:Zinc-dependent peptidase n=1 Tax=Thiohalobacter thiocyanaticus TaxID=585455 RepID=A0A426QM98_9GAMM|nr:M90 family metallopeptidase [Thiohalobacter thiocyanaticus]RRQ22880.1 zinc-dependent peptidase [Thiohalobacter thiocyanaticus]
MLSRWKNWRRRRVLLRHAIAEPLWQQTMAELPALRGLNRDERARLRELATLFLHQKDFYGANELEVSDTMALCIAAQACLLILNLDLDLYRDWSTIILYPDTFVAPREETDEAGVVHSSRHELTGESWEAGPVIVSWADAAPGAAPHGPGTNVIIHEFAHKLDMQTGSANGLPRLHRDMDVQAWSSAFSTAFEQLIERVEQGRETRIDPYAAQDPAEFFAVTSEYFFETPRVLREDYPEVYSQFCRYYRQDPAARTPGDTD